MVWVGLGGILGANARYLLAGWVAARLGAVFPYGTLLINVSGSFVLGLLMGVLEGHALSPVVRLSVGIGFLGAYTTFSTFTYETVRLLEEGSILLGSANAFGSLAVGLLAVLGGLAIGRVV
ncbi:MAG: fluoride efflux transporter CrcB [Deltaproteobacteria bacterium]|nr:fluoride efflux transporter CrcB [Deltaproteobacteria bacterium]